MFIPTSTQIPYQDLISLLEISYESIRWKKNRLGLFIRYTKEKIHKNPFIKWLIALSKHIFLILLSSSLSLSLSLWISRVLVPGYRSTDKWYTIIFHKYFIFRGNIYWRTQFWQLYAAGVFITRKTTVSMSFTNILSHSREVNLEYVNQPTIIYQHIPCVIIFKISINWNTYFNFLHLNNWITNLKNFAIFVKKYAQYFIIFC